MGRVHAECACSKTVADILAQLGYSEMIPVCSGETIDWVSGSALYVPPYRAYRFFSADCGGNEIESLEPAVFRGQNFFYTSKVSDEHHDITFSNVKFLQTGPGTSLRTEGTGTLDVLGCSFEGSDGGRAIRSDKNATVYISGCSFHGHATDDNGSDHNGAAIKNYGHVTIMGSMFSNNEAGDSGGAIFNSGNMTINNSTFSSNKASHGGGAICNDFGGTLAIQQSSTFTGNQADYGGAVDGSHRMASTTVENTTFVGNTAVENGGAIRSYESYLEVTGSTFEANVALGSGGGALGPSNTFVVLSGNHFVGNKGKGAGAVYLEAATCEMQGNRFTNNTSGSSGDEKTKHLGVHWVWVTCPGFVCAEGNTFIPTQDSGVEGVPSECDIDSTESPTESPEPSVSAVPTPVQTGAPTALPTAAPTQAPTAVPTAVPTASPTEGPTDAPTGAPTAPPTEGPTASPTSSPTPTRPSLCNTIIENDTSLSEDVVCDCDANSGPLITLTKWSMLDMNGHTVKCTDSSNTKTGACIRLNNKRGTVKNGTVANCNIGIKLQGSTHTVTNVSVLASKVGMVVRSINSLVLHNTIDASEDASTGGIKIAATGALIQGNTIPVADGYGINVLSGVGSTKILDNHITVSGEGVCFLDPGTSSKMEGNICND